jgi:hypothetical protein
MATFPTTLTPSVDSTIAPDRGLQTTVTEGGGIRGRVQYAQALYYLNLIFEDLNDTEVALIVDDPAAHFDTGPTSPHQITVRGVLYDVNYLGQPEVTDYHGVLRTMEVNLVGTKV